MCPADDDDDGRTPTTDSEAPLTAVDVAPITATDLNVLPEMSGEIASPGDAMFDGMATTEHDPLRAPRKNIDVNATIVTKKASDAAEQVRDEALDIKRDFDAARTLRRESSHEMKAQRVDVNATIVSKRAASAAELERDVAFEEIKRRKGDTDAPLLDAQDEALIATLKALPSEGVEPNWRMMEDAIADEVSGQPTYVPWWKTWQYVVPLGVCAAAAAITFVLIKSSAKETERTSLLAPRDAGVEQKLETFEAPGTPVKSTTLWLDGEAFELDDIPEEALQQLTPDLEDPTELETDTIGDDEAGILPITDWGWIDDLDDVEAQRAEAWLAGEKS